MKGRKLTAKERSDKLESDALERKRVFKELCEHVAGGLSLDCFGPLSVVSIREFLKKHPLEFVEEELIDAMRLGKSYWED